MVFVLIYANRTVIALFLTSKHKPPPAKPTLEDVFAQKTTTVKIKIIMINVMMNLDLVDAQHRTLVRKQVYIRTPPGYAVPSKSRNRNLVVPASFESIMDSRDCQAVWARVRPGRLLAVLLGPEEVPAAGTADKNTWARVLALPVV
jgi:hypothetical protein